MKRIREWISIKTVKAPGLVVLLGIVVANVVFTCIAALTVMWLAPPSLENTDFWSCLYYAVTMLVTSYIEIVELGETGAVLIIFCMIAVIIGMIAFTGAVIGYMSELIASFIENADSSSRKLRLSDHVVILNWNNRAVEIINELLYKNERKKIIVLVDANKDDILSDINERLSDTVETENEAVREACAHMSFFARRSYYRENRIKNKL